eukprot:2889526-Rhodomonas_salina.1
MGASRCSGRNDRPGGLHGGPRHVQDDQLPSLGHTTRICQPVPSCPAPARVDLTTSSEWTHVEGAEHGRLWAVVVRHDWVGKEEVRGLTKCDFTLNQGQV